jgi:uncharacterized protein YjbI with pentapeptide repeats
MTKKQIEKKEITREGLAKWVIINSLNPRIKGKLLDGDMFLLGAWEAYVFWKGASKRERKKLDKFKWVDDFISWSQFEKQNQSSKELVPKEEKVGDVKEEKSSPRLFSIWQSFGEHHRNEIEKGEFLKVGGKVFDTKEKCQYYKHLNQFIVLKEKPQNVTEGNQLRKKTEVGRNTIKIGTDRNTIILSGDYSNRDLSRRDFSGQDFSEARFNGANLSYVKLIETDLRGADFKDADLRGADLRGANLFDANFSGASLMEASLEGSNLKRSNLKETDFRKAYLGEANLREADLWGADLRQADLGRADLGRAYLREANFRGTNLMETNLRGADIRTAISLTREQIQSAIIDGTTLLPEDMQDLLPD